MIKVGKITVLSLLIGLSCTTKDPSVLSEKWKMEIAETERAFADRVLEIGMREAFLEFAAPDAVLMRDNRLIVGRNSISAYLKEPPSDGTTTSLTWKPDFVSVARSGDLGYTYGSYVFTITDSLGSSRVSTGIFHTVLKKQRDGNWHFVWD